MCECHEVNRTVGLRVRENINEESEPRGLILSELDKNYEHIVYLETMVGRLESRVRPVMGEPEPQIDTTEETKQYYNRSQVAELLERNNQYLLEQIQRVELITDLLQL